MGAHMTGLLFPFGSTFIPGWWLRVPPPAIGVVLFLADEHCVQTEKSPHKATIAPATPHDEDATNYVTTTKRPPLYLHEPHTIMF